MFFSFFAEASGPVDDYIYEYDLSEFDAKEPRHYRTIVPSKFFQHKYDKISASGMYTEEQLKFLKSNADKIGRPLLIIDIMAETHFFINGLPVRVTPKKHLQRVSIIPSDLIGKELKIYIKDEKEFTKTIVKTAEYERDLAKRYGVDYIRIPIRNMFAPEDSHVKMFMWILQNFSKSHLIHIHCKAGRGRTTTLLAVYSILKFSKKYSLKDIIKYHKELGGIDLSKQKAMKKDFIFKDLALDRAKFIEDFYMQTLQEGENDNNN